MSLYDDEPQRSGLTAGQKLFLFGIPVGVATLGLLAFVVANAPKEKSAAVAATPERKAAARPVAQVERRPEPTVDDEPEPAAQRPRRHAPIDEVLPQAPRVATEVAPAKPPQPQDKLQSIKNTVEKHFRKYANDPAGVEFIEWGEPRIFEPIDPERLPRGAILISATIRAKNALGAKAVTAYLFLVQHDRVVVYDTVRNSDAAGHGPLSPFAEPSVMFGLQRYQP
jgi:hypothetical protein